MQFSPGQVLGVRNLRQRQTNRNERPPQFQVHEILSYKGQYIFYASKLSHSVRVGRGVVTDPERPSVWALLPGEPAQNILILCDILKGDALAIEVRRGVYHILNWDGAIWADGHGQVRHMVARHMSPTMVKDVLLQRAQWAVDVWEYWRAHHGLLPEWFLLKRRVAGKPLVGHSPGVEPGGPGERATAGP